MSINRDLFISTHYISTPSLRHHRFDTVHFDTFLTFRHPSSRHRSFRHITLRHRSFRHITLRHRSFRHIHSLVFLKEKETANDEVFRVTWVSYFWILVLHIMKPNKQRLYIPAYEILCFALSGTHTNFLLQCY